MSRRGGRAASLWEQPSGSVPGRSESARSGGLMETGVEDGARSRRVSCFLPRVAQTGRGRAGVSIALVGSVSLEGARGRAVRSAVNASVSVAEDTGLSRSAVRVGASCVPVAPNPRMGQGAGHTRPGARANTHARSRLTANHKPPKRRAGVGGRPPWPLTSRWWMPDGPWHWQGAGTQVPRRWERQLHEAAVPPRRGFQHRQRHSCSSGGGKHPGGDGTGPFDRVRWLGLGD